MKARNGFTLVELLVVIALIAIISAILFPVVASARAKARQASCASNLRQMSEAIEMYVDDNDDHFFQFSYWAPNYIPPGPPAMCDPAAGDCPTLFWSDIIMPYVKNSGVFSCPSNADTLFNTAGYNLPGNVNPASNLPARYRCSYSINEPAFNEDFANQDEPRSVSYFGDTSSVALIGDGRFAWSWHSCQRGSDGKYSSYWDQSTGPFWGYGDIIGDIDDPSGAGTHHQNGSNFAFMDGHVKWVPLTIGGTEDDSVPDLYYGYFNGAKIIDQTFDTYEDCDSGSQ